MNRQTLVLLAALAAFVAMPAHASLKRGGWDGNGPSANGTAQGTSSPATVRGIELPAP